MLSYNTYGIFNDLMLLLLIKLQKYKNKSKKENNL